MRFPFTGVIPVDKPAGATSRQVVDAVARALGLKAVGHAGTLDPLAEGVVVVCVGHATKLVDFLHQQAKQYEAGFLLGRSSPSDDLETPVEEEPAVQEKTETLATNMAGETVAEAHVEEDQTQRVEPTEVDANVVKDE